MSAIFRKTAFTVTFALYDTTNKLITGVADGTVTKRISKDAGASAATTNAMAEIDAANMPGVYSLLLTATEMDAQVVSINIVAAGIIDALTLTIVTDPDIYTAKVSLTQDNANASDRYEVTWYKNAVLYPPTAGTPQIEVVKASDGTDLIAATNMTQIGATGRWRYVATTTARIADGATYLARVTATVDGATRTWEQPVSRDA